MIYYNNKKRKTEKKFFDKYLNLTFFFLQFLKPANESNTSIGSGKLNNSASQITMSQSLNTPSSTLLSQLNNSTGQLSMAKKSIGSIPPLPPSSANLTPRNKSKDNKAHFKLLNSNTNITSSSGNLNYHSKESNNFKSRILGRFNRKAHSKDLESLSKVDSSAPALKSITRSPSPSLTNFTAVANLSQTRIPATNTMSSIYSANLTASTSDYSSTSLSRNSSAANLQAWVIIQFFGLIEFKIFFKLQLE